MGLGKIALGYIDGKWKRILLAGAIVLDSCIFCCKQFLPPNSAVCGSDASCNNFCDSTYAYSQSECCPCPCPGRKDFPKCYSVSVFGATITTDQIPDYSPGKEGYYWKLLSSPAIPPLNECMTGDATVLHGFTYGYFAPDGTQIDTSDGNVQFSTPSAILVTTDPDTGLPIDPYLDVQIVIASNPGKTYVFDIDFVGGVNVKLPPCVGGSAVGTTDVHAYDTSIGTDDPDPHDGVGDSPPTVIVTPKCANCDGTPCSPGTKPAARCAVPTFTGSVKVGVDDSGFPIFEVVSIVLAKDGTCTWVGDDGEGIVVTVQPATGDCNLEDAELAGRLLWKVTIVTPLGTVSTTETSGEGVSACPPTFFDDAGEVDGADPGGDAPVVEDIRLSYGSDCGDPA